MPNDASPPLLVASTGDCVFGDDLAEGVIEDVASGRII